MPSKRDNLYLARAGNAPVGSTGSVSDRLRNWLIATYGGSGSINDLMTKNSENKNQLQ